MNAEANISVSKRTIKLAFCAVSVVLATGFVIYRLKFSFGIIDVLSWLFIYSIMAVVIGDVLKTIEYGKQTPWVLGVLCMPILVIPAYAVMYGKRNAL